MVKDARAFHFANLISFSKCNLEVLFDTIDNIVAPAPPDVPVSSNKDCSHFLFFLWLRWGMSGLVPLPLLLPFLLIQLGPQFWSPFCLQDLIDLVGNMKPSSSPVDILSASMFKSVLGSVGPCLVSIKNSSLQSGCVPQCCSTRVRDSDSSPTRELNLETRDLTWTRALNDSDSTRTRALGTRTWLGLVH